MARGAGEAAEVPTDRDLIARLRAGDTTAYEALWTTHVGAALRLARRYSPQHAEDLVSEAFIAAYEQIAVAGKGPDSAFRAYLFTIIRNAAAKKARVDAILDVDAEVDSVNTEDGMTLVARAEDAAHLLSTFKSLPERWQRALWLGEVERAPRADIARALNIRPNAVSALTRRAREGLRREWLTRLVPVSLRDDPAHAARYLVDYVAHAPLEVARPAIAAHLATCASCRDVHRDLENSYRRMRKATLAAVGFAALGVTLPTSAPAPAAAAVGVAAVGLAVLGSTGGAVSAGAFLAACGVAVALIASGPSTPSQAVATADHPAISAAPATTPRPSPPQAVDSPTAETPTPQTPAEQTPAPVAPGRGNTSPEVPYLDVAFDFNTIVTPRESAPAPPPMQIDIPAGDAPAGPAVVVDGVPRDTYVAPGISGTAPGAAAVYVALDTRVYAADLDPASGAWAFDAARATTAAGAHDYEVWAVSDSGAAGARSTGSFTLLAPTVAGFDNTSDFALDEASSTGIVFTAHGSPGGTLCVESDSGQRAELTLDADGAATRRVRFLAGGFYTLTFTVCTDDRWGAATQQSLFVDDPAIIFTPYEPDSTSVEFSDPAAGG